MGSLRLRDMVCEINSNQRWRLVQGESRRHFLDELRQARLAAQKDAESFDQILFVIERLGCFRLGLAATLGDYRQALLSLASESALGRPAAPHRVEWHSGIEELYSLVNQARNDALHQGARARHLTEHAIEFALVLEDALMNGSRPMTTIGDIMVRSPVCAEAWQPVSHVRQVMLTNSFSILPIEWQGEWRVVSDAQVASFLRKSQNGAERAKRLGMTLEEAHESGLKFESAIIRSPEDGIESVIDPPPASPVLVCIADSSDRGQARHRLVGILTPFDVL